MYVIAAFSAVTLICFLYAILKVGVLNSLPPLSGLVALGRTLSTTIAIALLGEFLRHFVSDSSPFGKRQSLRLLFAGLLFSLRMFIDCSTHEQPYELPVTTSTSFELILTTTAGPDLKVIVMIVFLICLAMVVRYGDALKEDSDSIA